MALTVDIVQKQFERAAAFSDQATTNAQALIGQLEGMATTYTPPAITEPGALPIAPQSPQSTALSTLAPVIFNPIDVPSDYPLAPTVGVTLEAAPTQPALVQPDTPALNFPAVPVAPTLDLTVDAIALPTLADATLPTLVMPNRPTLAALNLTVDAVALPTLVEPDVATLNMPALPVQPALNLDTQVVALPELVDANVPSLSLPSVPLSPELNLAVATVTAPDLVNADIPTLNLPSIVPAAPTFRRPR
jgi:hypothetical protein